MQQDEHGPDRSRHTASDWLAEAKSFESAGELFKAYDIATQGLAMVPHDLWLRHRAVLCLARAGATELACRQYDAYGLAAAEADHEDIAALRARLLKDQALATLDEADRRRAFGVAAERYGEIYRRTRGYYPGINAATLRLLAGDAAAAAALARRILNELDAAEREPATVAGIEADEFYRLATRVEALLLLGAVDAAHALVPRALAANGGDHAALATTWKQLQLVLKAKGIDAGRFAGEIAPPLVVHYVGHLIKPRGQRGRFEAADELAVAAQIAAHLARGRVGFGYGSLASGADILFAESLLRRGASLHVVVPFAREEFVDISVRPAGEDWVRRFEACYAAADTVRYATEDAYLGDDRLFAYCSRIAMGLAVLRARHLGTEAEQMSVWDGEAPEGVAGTAADVERWRASGLGQTIIPPRNQRRRIVADKTDAATPTTTTSPGGRLARAMLFCDIKGFSKLSDVELPRYIAGLLGEMAKVVDAFGNAVCFANTWGDGLFLVFEDVGQAAACALDLQSAIGRLDLAALGLPGHMALRVGGHFGPAYPAVDPVLKKINYFGAHVSRAARIEPVTPEGCVYVTETFAAVVALEHGRDFVCEYVGMTEAAKKYGHMRMFLLHRRRTPS
ncbi:MAG TPA: adenylate/guanylate cyclase domain-containing protein [Stellaceae bacterium]|nr:adenylate/guanylate cyclase domain-containing protein [Stellaceae bacterium]